MGISISNRLNWSFHCTTLLAKANNSFNLLRRTCYFIKNKNKKRTLYLTIVRSIFEHGSVIWAPSSKTMINNFESFQKRCIKWILNEQFISYSNEEYHTKLRSLDILPMSYKFTLTDIVIFHKIIHNIIPVSLPHYITTRTNTRSCDSLTFAIINSDTIRRPKNVFNSSFFPRTLSIWNSIPFEIRSNPNTSKFNSTVKNIFWDKISQQRSFDMQPD